MGVRVAQEGDLPAIVAMVAAKREQYEKWQPVFHRAAPDASAKHARFLKDQLDREKEGVLLLVHTAEEAVDAFLFLRLVEAPPVYQPGGKVALIDDCVVSADSAWPGAGKALLTHAMAWAKAQGAVLVNLVCGPKDGPKRALLEELGLAVASEWHVKTL
jgi:GNAT superfamily N-acetyltransferase